MENLYRKIKADLYRHIVKLDKNYPAYTLFLSVSDGESRAKVTHCSGDSLDKVWAELQEKGLQLSKELTGLPKYLRVDWVRDVRKTNIKQLTEWLTQVKRNYFRYGLAFDVNFTVAFLEQELNANAMLYLGNKIPYVAINRKNFTSYSKRRYPNSDFNIEQAQTVYMLDTQGVFCSVDEGSHLLYPKSREAGRRIKDKLGYNDVLDVIDASSQYLATQVKDQGDFYYGWHPCFDRYINTYNTLRHASTTYSMIEAWEVTKDVKLEQAINRSLSYIVNSLVKKVNVEHETLAFLVEHNGLEVKLGANAVCILALAKYSEITGTDKYLNLLNQLASGIEYMQNKDTGQFVHVLNYPDLSVKDEFRIIYYDGEAAFGLMRLYGLTKNNRWISIVEKAFDYFIKAEHWRAHDHWLSYCVNELTLYRNEEKYYKFGLQNVEGYLDFIANRITTFPTLLELIMAAEKMIVRLKSLGEHNHLLNGFDLEKFYLALEKRAHYVLNGFFWPEYAMYFSNPKKIVGSFFIRHHSFRVRIDDVEHYLSGLIAYLKYFAKSSTTKKNDSAIIVFGGDVNLGRRAHYLYNELDGKLIDVPAFNNSDLGIVNLECVLSTLGEQGIDKGEGGPYYFRARPEMANILIESGVDVVLTANNHSMDYGAAALLDQQTLLHAAGIISVGSGVDIESAFSPAYITVKSINIAIFNVDMTQASFSAKQKQAGTAYLNPSDTHNIVNVLKPKINLARKKAHIIILAAHYGNNNIKQPSDADKKAAYALIEAGADVVLGTSAHVLQGIEIYKGKPIIHDAGDLFFDAIRNKPARSGVFQLKINKLGIEEILFKPVSVYFGKSIEDSSEAAISDVYEYIALCKKLNTIMHLNEDGYGVVKIPVNKIAIASDVQEETLFSRKAKMRLNKARLDKLESIYTVSSLPDNRLEKSIDLGPLVLHGLLVSPDEFNKREMLWVESFWSIKEATNKDYRIGFKAKPLSPSKMPVWGLAQDHDPCDWMIPTSRWRTGKIYRDYYGVRPPLNSKLVNGDMQLVVEIVLKSKILLTYDLPIYFRVDIYSKRIKYSDPFKYKEAFNEEILHNKNSLGNWTAKQIAEVTGGSWSVELPDSWYVNSVAVGPSHIDMVDSPVLFAARTSKERAYHEQMKETRKWNAHNVVNNYTKKLCGVIASEQIPDCPATLPILKVDDVLEAVLHLGIANRQRLKSPVIAVTGSAGKTSIVSMLKDVFGQYKNTFISYDNYNSRCGVLITLASAPINAELVALEVAESAINSRNQYHIKLLNPTIAVISNISPSHLVNNKTVFDIARRKINIVEQMQPKSHILLNRQSDYYEYMVWRAKKRGVLVLSYGMTDDCDIQLISYDWKEGLVIARLFDDQVSYSLSVSGRHMALNSLVCLGISHLIGDSPLFLLENFKKVTGVTGRGEIFKSNISNCNITVIDESYNANPISMKAALDNFSNMKDEMDRYLILGDMLELGVNTVKYHEELLPLICDCAPSKVFLIGETISKLKVKLQQLEILCFVAENVNEIYSELCAVVKKESILLVKSSNGIGLGELVKRLKD